jgi:hypothetical protein
MPRLFTACGLVLLLTVAVPGAARAQDPAGANDPSAGSPAGTVYQIPLDTARHDAAPRSNGGGGGAGSGSPLRSENGFGSSSQVPGATTGGGATPTAGTAGGASAPAGSGTNGASGSGTKSGGAGGGGSGSASTPSSSAQDSSTTREALIRAPDAHPSSTRTYLLLAAAVAVALALAAAGRLLARRR